MNTKEIKELIDLLKGSDVSEIEIEREGIKIKIKKGASGAVVTPVMTAPQSIVHMPAVQQAAIPAPSAPAAASVPASAKSLGSTINSPMVGTFYKAPSPESVPFIKEGDIIKEGQTVCIIEAMKLMNELKSETKGRITKILVENGQAVEFGQPLFVVEPA
ncbi:MAG: acetyl-CoA carboxylase, biotin carboxyl carrier protein [Candidatus Firestonebacteria bacterium RIFOXYC2_FULL_39_67]|nr:MAG: acetyl-CoA carboxylase, biotin carboxyl carrier protein [Candidatus Firestonebacteria bacterium RIFOXYD2_FULL_39_29]OGF55394.1 MAG: acetyl-CoA carboxylase, biotin carboxyl carrier protein [Candidatus Firestonebacteria bacterium RIFOXYC2_FULL_39_67]OGF56113.1 MAG: acetyl-CoA carboxylase, biotin carboxyl carrier protein [Candidatus Firestonebacteria bacterium RifOxyC12_full_39_7]